jgi:hypothetical protein
MGGGRILKRNLVVYEHRGTGERLSLTYLQTEREIRRVHTSCAICWRNFQGCRRRDRWYRDIVIHQCLSRRRCLAR